MARGGAGDQAHAQDGAAGAGGHHLCGEERGAGRHAGGRGDCLPGTRGGAAGRGGKAGRRRRCFPFPASAPARRMPVEAGQAAAEPVALAVAGSGAPSALPIQHAGMLRSGSLSDAWMQGWLGRPVPAPPTSWPTIMPLPLWPPAPAAAERQAGECGARVGDCGAVGPPRRRHHRHQHGWPRHRHPAGRQPRWAGGAGLHRIPCGKRPKCALPHAACVLPALGCWCGD